MIQGTPLLYLCIMKAKSKKELANYAGVSIKTLTNWLQPFLPDLIAMGYRQGQKVLPPNVVLWICDKLCIDVEEE